MKTKKYWEMHAEQHPYWAVVTWDKFKDVDQNSAAFAEFFATGEDHIAGVFKVIATFAPQFSPKSALDFGCGVGRLLVPLAKRGLSVSGIDIAEKMLDLTRANLGDQGVTPIDLVMSVENLPEAARYDLVHSFIAIQHVPVLTGVPIFAKLLDRVSPDGVAVLHVTYSPSTEKSGTFWPYMQARLKGLIIGNPILKLFAERVRGRKMTPPILMENYPLNDLFAFLDERGFTAMTLRPTSHGGHRGLLIFATRVATSEAQF